MTTLHNKNAKNHTIEQVEDRCKLVWTKSDIDMICGWIALKKNAIFLGMCDQRKHKGCELWGIVWKNQFVKVVYDGKIGTLRTVLRPFKDNKTRFENYLEEVYCNTPKKRK